MLAMSKTLEQIIAYDRFKHRYPDGCKVVCNKCDTEKSLDEFYIKFCNKNGSPSYSVRKPCKSCDQVRFKKVMKSKERPDWIPNDEFWHTIMYANFLIRACKKPVKRCYYCKEDKHRIFDFWHRQRGQFYTVYDLCKKCHILKSDMRKKANKEKTLAVNRVLHHKHSKAVSDSYVKKQIRRKSRTRKYKDDPSLLPTLNEQRLSLIKYRVDKFIKDNNQDT
jgi:hypothetical protein